MLIAISTIITPGPWREQFCYFFKFGRGEKALSSCSFARYGTKKKSCLFNTIYYISNIPHLFFSYLLYTTEKLELFVFIN